MAILDVWHPINGEWVHIVQEDRGNSRAYFTNGELIAQETIRNFGKILKPTKAPSRELIIDDNYYK
jgi:hypothetical protein